MKNQVNLIYRWTLYDIKHAFWNLFVNRIAASILTPRVLRYILYKCVNLKINTPSMLYGSFIYNSNITIGKGSFVNSGCFFENNLATVNIGERCQIGMNVMFCTSSHYIGNESQRAGNVFGKSINVGDGTWIGTKSVILPGVTIGKGCVIGAGAVVVKDCEPNGLYVGVPAKRIKDL